MTKTQIAGMMVGRPLAELASDENDLSMKTLSLSFVMFLLTCPEKNYRMLT